MHTGPRRHFFNLYHLVELRYTLSRWRVPLSKFSRPGWMKAKFWWWIGWSREREKRYIFNLANLRLPPVVSKPWESRCFFNQLNFGPSHWPRTLSSKNPLRYNYLGKSIRWYISLFESVLVSIIQRFMTHAICRLLQIWFTCPMQIPNANTQ